MRTVSWSDAAGGEFDSWIDHLIETAGDAMALRAQRDVALRVAQLNVRALAYRPSMLWPGLREMSLQPWHKLAVYSVERDQVRVLGFYDMRQNLSAVDPLSE